MTIDSLMKINLLLGTFLICFLVTSCATNMEFNHEKVDPAFQPYVSDYYKLLEAHCPSKKYETSKYYSITFNANMNPNWAGVCHPRINGYTINIDPRTWYGISPDDQRMLIYHEMAHCLIEQQHIDDVYNYMYPSTNYLPREVYTDQAVTDILNYCNDTAP